MRRPLYAVLATALMLAPASLAAQDALPQPISNATSVKVTGVGDHVIANWANVYVGPYDGRVFFGSGDPTGAQVSLYCVDYVDDVRLGDQWSINVSNLGGTSPDVSNTLQKNLGEYEQAAYLSSLFDSWASYVGYVANATTGNPAYDGIGSLSSSGQRQLIYSGIHAAIWSIMNGTQGFPNLAGINATLATDMATPFLTLAGNNYGGMDFSQWAVLSDVGNSISGHPGQEYLVHTTVTPEPETYVLLLTGLLMILGVTWIRRRKGAGASIAA